MTQLRFYFDFIFDQFYFDTEKSDKIQKKVVA